MAQVGFRARNKPPHERGFSVIFDNGYTVSVQFSGYNYTENREALRDVTDASSVCWKATAPTAETAVWASDGALIVRDNDPDSVRGWQTPAEVLELLVWAAAQAKVD